MTNACKGLLMPTYCIQSTQHTDNCPRKVCRVPTGRGRMLMTARLIFKIAANWKRPLMSDLATSAPTATMATGPDRFSFVFSKLKTSC
jgi:hypothetical protein